MAIISSFAIVRSLCLFHLTLAWYLLSAPRVVAEQNLVLLFGEAMRIVKIPFAACQHPR